MLSRRNIRIKVMQVLYAMNRDSGLTPQKALTLYRKNISQSFELYLHNLYQFIKVAEYARVVKKKKREKLRPTSEDLAFEPIIADNNLINSLSGNKKLLQAFQINKIGERVNEDITRILYKELSKTEEYIQYLQLNERSDSDHLNILLQLYKLMTVNEVFEDILDEKYLFWDDDKSLIVGAMKKTIKGLPNKEEFFEDYRPADDAVKEFGEVLLEKVNSESKALFDVIEPTLKNWDADRVAVIDMILLKMAVCELMSFPTIPTKVTLNEFVEISKMYSTDKSKDFINGILDRLLKKLEKDGKIVKQGRGLIQ